LFANQTQALVQAIASSIMAQIKNDNDNRDVVVAGLDRIVKAVGDRPRAVRPGDRG